MIPAWLADWRRLLRDAPRWLFLVALVYAPWAYGCTTERTIEALNWMVAAVVALWVISAVVVRRRPVLPPLMLASAAALLAFGWWMVWNAQSVYDSQFLAFVPVARVAQGAPGSIDLAISFAWMIRGTLLVGVVLFVTDLSQRSSWLLRLWWTVVLTGGSIALLGLVQKASNAEMIFWGARPTWARFETFFSTFYYHANAGAYLNLVLPLAAGLAARAVAHRRSPIQRAFSVTALVTVVAAAFANTSKMGQLLAAVAIVALLFAFRARLTEVRRAFGWRTTLLASCGVVLALAAVVQAGRLEKSIGRWSAIGHQLSNDSRWLAAEAAMRGIPEAGWFGFGPGTFRVAFPYLTGYLGEQLDGVWRFLHQDYLQTVLEWGHVGTTLWLLLFAGAAVTAGLALRSARADAWTPRRKLLLQVVLLALATVLLHGVVDFPLQIASIQLYVAAYLGICWGSARWPREM